MTRIKLVGRFDDDNDSFFSGTSVIDSGQTGQSKYHLGEPIEEILYNLDVRLRQGKVEIEFLQSEQEVQRAKDYFGGAE